nr:hypothetical protein [Actinokineospora sp. NBRC 105648]
MKLQDQDGARVESDGRGGVVRLGSGVAGLPPVLDDLVEHVDRARPQMRVDLPQTTPLTTAETDVGDEVEQGVEPVLGDVIEEQAGQVRGPDHHRGGHLTGLQPVLDAFRGPDHRLRAVRGRHLDPLGRVERDQLRPNRVIERLAQRLPDALHRRHPHRTLIPHRRDPRLILARARIGDLVVVLGDLLEHVPDMSHPDLVDPQAPQVRDQVETDVGLVTAIGITGQPLAPWQPLQQPLLQRGVDQYRQVGLEELADLVDRGQRPLGLDRRGDRVPDPPQRLDRARFGQGQQLPGMIQLRLRLGRRVESGSAARPAGTTGVGGQFDAIGPLPVAAAFELGTGRAQLLAVAAAAGAPSKYRSQGHRDHLHSVRWCFGPGILALRAPSG